MRKKQNIWIWIIIIAVVMAGIYYTYGQPKEDTGAGIDVIFYDVHGNPTRLSSLSAFTLVDGAGPWTEMSIETWAKSTETEDTINVRNRLTGDDSARMIIAVFKGGSEIPQSQLGPTCRTSYVSSSDNFPYSEKTIAPGRTSSKWYSCQSNRVQLIDCTKGDLEERDMKLWVDLQGKKAFLADYPCNTDAECQPYSEEKGFRHSYVVYTIKEVGNANFRVYIKANFYSMLQYELWRASNRLNRPIF